MGRFLDEMYTTHIIYSTHEVLFEADASYYECDAGDFGLREVEGRIVLVVGDDEEGAVLFARHDAFDEDALFACGDDVAAVPLYELGIMENGASDDVARLEVRVHGES